MRWDGLISWPYYIIFLPLFIWKVLALAGAVTGCVSHCRNPPKLVAPFTIRPTVHHFSNDMASEIEYRTMILCAGQHFLMLLFEVLACYKLESNDPDLKWILVFVPVVFESIISIIVCIWSVRQERSIEVGRVTYTIHTATRCSWNYSSRSTCCNSYSSHCDSTT
jgi:hypothetical protein